MDMIENLPAKLCLFLTEQGITAEQWKLLGQEKDGCILLGWMQTKNDSKSFTVVGCYDRLKDELLILHSFTDVYNIVQATINQSHTLLGYVIKYQKFHSTEGQNSQDEASEINSCDSSSSIDSYEAYVIELKSDKNKIHDLDIKRNKQIRIQFLYKEKEESNSDIFLLLIHKEFEPPQTILNSLNDSNTVHFAYSVTLLHHSCVIHCVIPGIPWSRAKLIRPTFAIYENDHMIIFVQDMFVHLLEIGMNHEPRCHILCGPLTSLPLNSSYLVPLLDLEGKENYKRHESVVGNNSDNRQNFKDSTELSTIINSNLLTIDLPTLDLVRLSISSDFLIDVFRTETAVEVRLGILHYFLCHRHDMDIIAELVSIVAEKPRQLDIVRYMQEILIGGSYSAIQKNLLADAIPLLSLMPVTTMEEQTSFEVKVNNLNITLSHEKLWNTSVMLLSPQQRLVPYRIDLWTKLWDQLSKNSGDKPRFKTSQLAEKLLVSLGCYEPEALSRCSTPMSPGAGLSAAMSFGDIMGSRNRLLDSSLPFAEVESCTASKQEHIVSVNLRELSMYLLKHGVHTSSSYIKGSCTPLHVHAMATRHVTAQLEISRLLCQFLCRAANVDPRLEQEQGFMLIEQLDNARKWLLYILLEKYRFALESIAFPAPQGFTSFFTYLGYRTLKYSMFLQYIQRNVFELQVDVSKIIMADITDTKENIIKKLALLSLLPKARAKRLLNQWLHPVSFMLRAREHAANILSGQVVPNRIRISKHRNHYNALAAFPSADRLSPLDTFLDLLTAKASLAELDFGLLIDATVTSTEDFL